MHLRTCQLDEREETAVSATQIQHALHPCRETFEQGLIEELAESPDPSSTDERRRYYRLTRFSTSSSLFEGSSSSAVTPSVARNWWCSVSVAEATCSRLQNVPPGASRSKTSVYNDRFRFAFRPVRDRVRARQVLERVIG
jgi:hypothetical protein